MTRETEQPYQTLVFTKNAGRKISPGAGDAILTQPTKRNIIVLLHQMISYWGSKPRINQSVLSPFKRTISWRFFRLLCTSNCLLVTPDWKSELKWGPSCISMIDIKVLLQEKKLLVQRWRHETSPSLMQSNPIIWHSFDIKISFWCFMRFSL